MKESNQNWIKAYIIDVLPIMSIFLYVLAFLYNIAFYSVFNINIISYISLSELLLSILEPLILFVFFSIVGVWLNWILIEQLLFLSRKPQSEKTPTNYKIRRILVSVKRWKISTYLIKLKECFFIKKKNKEKDHLHIFIGKLIIPSLIFFISYVCFKDTKPNPVGDYGLSYATLGLIIPYFVIVMLLYISLAFKKIQSKILAYIKSLNRIDYILIFLSFYIYALCVFFSSGKQSGTYYKKNSQISFEIRTADRSKYTDSTYIYIGQMGGNIFLLEKASESNIILNKNSTSYVKIKNKVAPLIMNIL